MRNTADFMRDVYGFCFIQYKTTKIPPPRICMKDVEIKVRKSKALQRHLRITSLSPNVHVAYGKSL